MGARAATDFVGFKRNFRLATKIASAIGTGFAFLLMIGGVVSFVFGSFIGGIWWFILGMFLQGASQTSYQQVILRDALQGEQIKRFMTPNPVTVPPTTSVKDLVENYVYRYQRKMFPVATEVLQYMPAQLHGRWRRCPTLQISLRSRRRRTKSPSMK